MSPTPPLHLTLHVPPVADPSRHFVVVARFTNTSTAPLQLLMLFAPLPVFFTAKLVAATGGAIDVAGMGKLDPPEGSLHSQTLAVGASLDVSLDLAPWIRGAMAPGQYELSLQYHNAYGESCFKGVVESPPVSVHVGTGRQA